MSRNTLRAPDFGRDFASHSGRRHGAHGAAELCRGRLRAVHTSPSIPPEARTLMTQGVSVIVATRDAGMRPHIARAWGPEVLGQHGPVRVCVEAPEGSATARNLVERPEIAITFLRPSTYQSVQLKGLTGELREPTDEELGLVDQHMVAFSADVREVGIQLRLVPRLMDRASLMSLAVVVEELYDQTPGRAAGMPL